MEEKLINFQEENISHCSNPNPLMPGLENIQDITDSLLTSEQELPFAEFAIR